MRNGEPVSPYSFQPSLEIGSAKQRPTCICDRFGRRQDLLALVQRLIRDHGLAKRADVPRELRSYDDVWAHDVTVTISQDENDICSVHFRQVHSFAMPAVPLEHVWRR